MEQSLKLFESISITLASHDASSIRRFDGPAGFKSQLLQLMKSKDDTVSGFAAIVLAITGDTNYAPDIAALLTRKTNLPPDRYPPVTVRGRAAVALSILGTKQYTEQIVPLLKSANDYDRSGGVMALGYLKATEHAKDVIDLMLNSDLNIHDDGAAIEALFEMGVAANYKNEIAQILTEESGFERRKVAAYGLAHLRANEHAADIANRLDSIGKGDLAKALALMGAKEHADRIATLLEDKSEFNQRDAVLALGILGVTKYEPNIARLLKNGDWWTRYIAALSLVLLEADSYAKDAIAEIEKTHKAGDYFDVSDFHFLVKDEVLQLDAQFRARLARMKAKLAVSSAARLEL
jgi:HEAT repeat protein